MYIHEAIARFAATDRKEAEKAKKNEKNVSV